MTKTELKYLIKEELKSLKESWDLNGMEDFKKSDKKWDDLAEDLSSFIEPLIEKHSNSFDDGEYGVINAIYDILDNMFEKIPKE